MSPILGWHWLGEARGCDRTRLEDPDVATALLCTLSDALQLARAAPPSVVRPEPGGLVAVVLLAESHASLHVPPEGDVAFVDVFSCRGAIDGARCADAVRAALGAAEVHHRTVRRSAE